MLHFLEVRPAALDRWLGGEDPEGEDPPAQEPEPSKPVGQAPAPGAAPAPTLSRRLEVDRSKLGRGVLLMRVPVPAAGALRQVGQILTSSGPIEACTTELAVAAAGAPTVRCRLSPAVRERLAARRLTLQLQTRFESGEGAASVTSSIRLPRQAG